MFNDATLTRLLKIIGKTTSKTKAATGVPFVVTYRPNFKVLGKFIHENLNFIYIYISMTTLRIPLHQDQWSLLELPEYLIVIWLELNYSY